MAAAPRKKQAQKKPAPLTLKGSNLEDFLPLLPAEEKLRQCAANGEKCIVDDFSGERPEEATKLNSIRAEFLRYMILGGCRNSAIHAKGISVKGAYILCQETFDLEAINICKDLKLHDCLIQNDINFSGANTKNISLKGSQVTSLIAERAIIAGSLNLDNNFVCDGMIRLSATNITGNLICENAHLRESNNSLIANRAKIDGDVDLENVISKGTIVLTGTEIGGGFTPQGASLEGSPALQLRNTKIGGTLVWRSLKFANGEVDFSGASCKNINTDGEAGCASAIATMKNVAKMKHLKLMFQKMVKPSLRKLNTIPS